MLVVRATLEHLDEAARLFGGYRAFYQRAPEPEREREFIRQRLALGDSVIFLAVSDDGRGAGFMQLYPAFSSLSMAPMWILNDLFVDASQRARGTARLLMESARQLAVETGAVYVELSTARTNDPAQRLYESLGYQRDDEFLHYALDMRR
jgi:GNAT superfamily N-acetyltransferase